MTSVGYVTATFRVVETRIDSKWPDGDQALRPAHAVYQVLHASFDLDPGRALSDEQAEGLRCLAARYRNITNANPPKGGGPPKPSGNGTPPDRSGHGRAPRHLDEYPSPHRQMRRPRGPRR